MVETSETTFITNNNYKEPIGGGKKDRHPCPNSGEEHDWECNTTSCENCWDPPCKENSEKEQQDYEEKQSREGKTADEKLSEYGSQIDDEIARGSDIVGLQFEKNALSAVGADNIEYYSYKAHCTKCHVQGEIDIVTKNSVIECKNSPKGFKLDQINENIKPIAEKCFPGRKLVFATRLSEKRRLENKLRQWKQKGYISEYTALGV